MVMNVWEAQRSARRRTALYIATFIFLTVGIAFLIDAAFDYLAKAGYIEPTNNMGFIFLVVTCLIAFFYYMRYATQGGKVVAQSLGAREVLPTTTDYKERQLYNIVEEMAVASGLPMPQVFLLEAQEINAFAAGVKPENAAVTVTRGALEFLTRDELQGVIAHELGHIKNADMKVNMRLAAMVMAFVFVLYIGMRLLQSSFLFGGRRREGGGNPLALIALVFLVAGAITWFAGAILRSMVSRQREYLADASAAQFTRNPSGIANALRKIAKMKDVHDMPGTGMAYSHLYFENHSFWASLFSTHPPLEKRIAALEGRTYFEKK